MTDAQAGRAVVRFSTANVPSGLQDDAWRQITSPTYDTARVDGQEAPLSGSIMSLPVDDVLFGRTSFGPQSYARTKRTIAASGLDCMLVQLFVCGGLLLHEGSGTIVSAGDIVIYDLGRPFAASTDGGATISVLLPRDLLQGQSRRQGLHGTVVRRGEPLSALLTAYLLQLGTLLFDGEIPDEVGLASIRHSTVSLLASAASGHPHRVHASVTDRNKSLRSRIEAFIESNAENPALTPSLIAQQFSVSRPTLYRLFDDGEGVASLIRGKRLESARLRLLTESSARVSDVAFAAGMSSVRTFTRAFQDRFGISPTALRDDAISHDTDGAATMHDVFRRVESRFSALTA